MPNQELLFHAHHQDGEISFGLIVGFAHPAGDAESGNDAGETVEVSALRNGVGMRAADQGGQITVFTGDGHPDVAGFVFRNFEAEFFSDFFEVLKNLSFHLAVALAGYALAVKRHCTNIVKTLLREFKAFTLEICRHEKILLNQIGWKWFCIGAKFTC